MKDLVLSGDKVIGPILSDPIKVGGYYRTTFSLRVERSGIDPACHTLAWVEATIAKRSYRLAVRMGREFDPFGHLGPWKGPTPRHPMTVVKDAGDLGLADSGGGRLSLVVFDKDAKGQPDTTSRIIVPQGLGSVMATIATVAIWTYANSPRLKSGRIRW